MSAEPKPDPGLIENEDILVQADAKPPWRKIALLGLVLALVLGIVYLSPLRHHIGKVREVSDWFRSFGLMAPVVMTFTVALLVAVGFPRLAFCVIAGMALGFWSGLLWTQLGTLLGNYAVFLFVRAHGGEWIQKALAKRGKLARLVRDEGLTGVVLARQLPLPGFAINLTLGLVGLRHRDFLIGTALGQLPGAIPCTLIGAGMVKASFAKSAGLIAVAVACAVLLWAVLKWFVRSRHHPKTPPPACPGNNAQSCSVPAARSSQS